MKFLINGKFDLLIFKAIQLLSNTQPLADYFIADLHVREINEENKLGSKGNVTKAFADLIKFFINLIKFYQFYIIGKCGHLMRKLLNPQI